MRSMALTFTDSLGFLAVWDKEYLRIFAMGGQNLGRKKKVD